MRFGGYGMEDANTLDLMSGGRLLLCFGTDYRPEEFTAFGIAIDGKGARFRECLAVIQKAWAGPFTHHGKHCHIPMSGEPPTAQASPVSVLPRPLQASIPLWLAAFGTVGVNGRRAWDSRCCPPPWNPSRR